jgi:DNA-binding NtrC family response regulator
MINPLKASILIIDTSKSARNIARNSLKSDGYLVVDLPSTNEVLGAAKDLAFDVLIIDPFVLNSQKLIERMTRCNPFLRVIYVSEYSVSSLETIGLCPRGTDITKKPFTENEIVKRVEDSLTSGRMWQAPSNPLGLRLPKDQNKVQSAKHLPLDKLHQVSIMDG